MGMQLVGDFSGGFYEKPFNYHSINHHYETLDFCVNFIWYGIVKLAKKKKYLTLNQYLKNDFNRRNKRTN